MCRGIEFEAVKPRHLPMSIGCSKNFQGKSSLATKEQVQTNIVSFWLIQEVNANEVLLNLSLFQLHIDWKW